MTANPGRGWPAAVLWDMDGTLVDTEPYWIDAEIEFAEQHGRSWTPAQGLQLVGNALPDSARVIQQQLGIDETPEAIIQALLRRVIEKVEHHVPWRTGALELLADLVGNDIPTALVTMSYASLVDPVLAALPPGSFRCVVTGDQVTLGKPHPEPYLAAATALGVAAEECLAIEDSDNGARSAEAAGCTVLVVPNHVPVPTAGRRLFIDSLREVTAAGLCSLRS